MQTASEERNTPPRRHRLRRVLGWGLVVLLALVILAPIAARLYFTPGRLTPLVVDLLHGALRGRFEIERITWTLPLGVTVENASAFAPDGTRVIHVDHAKGALDLPALIGGTVEVGELRVRGAEVRLEPGEKVLRYALVEAFEPRAASTSTGSGGIDLRFEDIVAERFDLHLDDPAVKIEVRGATLTAGRFSLVSGELRAGADLAVPHAELLVRTSTPFAFGPMRGEVQGASLVLTDDPEESQIAVSRFRLEQPGLGWAEGSGTLAGISAVAELPLALSIDARGTGELDHPQVRALLPKALFDVLDPTGTVTLTAEIRGPPEDVQVAFDGSGSDLVVFQEPVDHLEAKGRWSSAALVFERLTATLAEGDGRLELKGSLGLFEQSFEAKLERFPVKRIAGRSFDPELFPERASGTLRASGPVGTALELTVDAELVLSGLPPLGVPLPDPVSVDLSAKLDPKRARIRRLTVSGGPLRVEARGSVGLSENGALDLDVEITHDRPSTLLRHYALPLTAGRASLDASIAGTLKKPRIAGRLRSSRLRFSTGPSFELSAPLELAGDRLTLRGLVLTSTAGSLGASGSVELPALRGADDPPLLDLQAVTSTLSLAAFTGGWIQGRAKVTADVKGPASTLDAGLTAELSELEVRGVRLGPVTARARAAEGKITVEPLVLVPEAGGTIAVSGSWTLDTEELETRLTAKNIPLSLADTIVERPLGLGGHLSMTASASGSLDALRADAQVVSEDLTVGDEPIGAVGAVLSASGERVEGTLAVSGPAGRLEVAGSYGLKTEEISAQLTTAGLKLEALPGVQQLGLSLAGALDVSISARGRLPYPDLQGSLQITGLEIAGRKLPAPLELLVEPTDRRGAHQLLIGLGPRLQARAVLDLAGEPMVDAFVELRRLALTEVFPELAEQGVDGEATGTIALTYRGDTAAVRGEADLRQLSLRASGQHLELQRPAQIRYDGKTISFEHLELAGPLGRIELYGQYGERMELRADGSLDLAFVSPLFPVLAQAQGRVEVHATASGTADDPVFSGEIAFSEEVRLRPRSGVRELILSGGRVRLDENRLTISDLEGKIAGGVFELSGSAELQGLAPKSWDLRFQALNLPFRTGDVTVEANADIRLAGPFEAPRLSGQLEIIRGRYQKRFKLQNFIFVAEDDDTSEPLTRSIPWLRDLELDVKVVSSGAMDLRVDAGTIDVTMALGADLRIQGTAAEPQIEGRIAAERGRIRFPKATLEIVRCAVDFDPRLEHDGLDAEIDLQAEGDVSTPSPDAPSRRETVQVFMTLEGALHQMQLDLSSQPALDRLQVLALLVTGYANLSDLATGAGEDSATVDAALAFAGAQLTGPVSSFLEDQLERSLNFAVRLGAEVSGSGFRVTASKEITRRLTVEGAYEQTFEQTSQITTTARALLQLFNRVFLEASTERTTGPEVDPSRPATTSRIELKFRVLGE